MTTGFDLIPIAKVAVAVPLGLMTRAAGDRLLSRNPALAQLSRDVGALPENEDIEFHAYRAHLGTLEHLLERQRGNHKRQRARMINPHEPVLAAIVAAVSKDIKALRSSHWRSRVSRFELVSHDRAKIEQSLMTLEQSKSEQTTVSTVLADQALSAIERYAQNLDLTGDLISKELPLDELRALFRSLERGYLATFRHFVGDEIKFGPPALFRILALKELIATRADVQATRSEMLAAGRALCASVDASLRDAIGEIDSSIDRLTDEVLALRSDLERLDPGQPRLTLPHQRSDGTASRYFLDRALPLIGRDSESQRLRDFRDSEDLFSWFQIAGVGGQGKSRLSLEFAIDSWKTGIWNAGFIVGAEMNNFETHWRNWQPSAPTLIVVDYVLSRIKSTRHMLATLVARTGKHSLDHPVRVLLVERQPWNQVQIQRHEPKQELKDRAHQSQLDESHHQSSPEVMDIRRSPSSEASWFAQLKDNERAIEYGCYVDGVLPLTALAHHELHSVVREWLLKLDCYADHSDMLIDRLLEHLDPQGRPLYAYLLAEVLARSAVSESFADMTRNDLLDEILHNERTRRWRAHFGDFPPSLDSGCESIGLSWLATMVGEVNFTQWKHKLQRRFPEESTRVEAQVITDSGISATGPSRLLQKYEPDILGGRFLLNACNGALDWEEWLQDAWALDPSNTAATILRLCEDHSTDENLPSILRVEPNTEEGREKLLEITPEMAALFYVSSVEFPEEIFERIRVLANRSDPVGMFFYAICFKHGLGIAEDEAIAFEWFEKASKRGLALANYQIGLSYEHRGVPRFDQDLAVKYLELAANGDVRDAANSLGDFYNPGNIFGHDNLEKTLHWYQRAADMGCTDSMFDLAEIYADGKFVTPDQQRAFGYFKEAAERKHAKSAYELYQRYSEGFGVRENEVEALRWLRAAAELKEENAMNDLGVQYFYGNTHVPMNKKEAIRLYLSAARKGNKQAMSNLVYCYRSGDGVKADPSEAFRWSKESAAPYYPEGYNSLGVCYLEGFGVQKDLGAALEHLYKGAVYGSFDAMANLGLLVILDSDCDIDPLKASYYLKKAVKNGNLDAMVNRAFFYLDGIGLKRDSEKGFALALRAAKSGNARAMALVGSCYEDGDGTRRNRVAARSWYQKALDAGLEIAAKALEDMNSIT